MVAMSGYRSDCVDNWNGGTFEVVLSIPVAQFDQVDAETRSALETAARDIIGDDHFSSLGVEVRLLDAEDGWEQELFNRLFGSRGIAVPPPQPEGESDAPRRPASTDPLL